MKAIILAAGKGTRLGGYTKNIPKAMLPFKGKTLIGHQVDLYRQCGVERIIIVCGYREDRCTISGTIKYVNERYDQTNMVESLMTVREELNGELIVSYGDIVFEKQVLQTVMKSTNAIGVAVDMNWKNYWLARYGTYMVDTESLVLGPNGQLLEIGQPSPDSTKMHGRYVGLLRFSSKGINAALNIYDVARKKYQGKPWQTAKTFETAYMTDLLQEIVDSGFPVCPILVKGGWLEFDTCSDYEKAMKWAENGELDNFINLPEPRCEHS